MKISKQLCYKVTPLNLLNSVYKDRHEFLTKLKNSLNIGQSYILTEQTTGKENILSDNKTDEDNYLNKIETDEEVDDCINFDGCESTLFCFNIPFEKYLEFKPISVEYTRKLKKRKYNVLKQNKWSDVINDAFFS